MTKVLVAVLGIAALVGLISLRGNMLDSTAANSQQQEPMATNDKVIVVRGWSESELRGIVANFLHMYEISPQVLISSTPTSATTLQVSFPDDLAPDHFFFLVNYLNYPHDVDLTTRKIAVVGRTTLTPDFKALTAFQGSKAEVYVPVNDRDYDLVYVRTESGAAFEYSFAKEVLEPVSDARVPATLEGL